MKAKDHFLESSTFNIHNGEQIRFWEDKWLGNFTLKEQHSCFRSAPLNIMFRRALVGDKLQRWNGLVTKVAFVQLYDQRDSIKWNLTKQGTFTMQSMYQNLVNQIAYPLNKSVWKLEVPLKIKVFDWFVLKGFILTKGNLLKRNWRGDDKCVGAEYGPDTNQ
jgi:hypothetical protein